MSEFVSKSYQESVAKTLNRFGGTQVFHAIPLEGDATDTEIESRLANLNVSK